VINVVLEPASREFVDAAAKPPFPYEMTPADARKVLDDLRAAPVDKLPVREEWVTVPAYVGDVRVRLVRPPPDTDRRAEITASPLRATEQQLAGLPPAFLIVDEADVLRDEGEAYAAKLRAAGVPITTVRYDGITHDFMMLNPLSGTRATRAAVAQASAVLRSAFEAAQGPKDRRQPRVRANLGRQAW
jgi:acetyl esterase/lipase